jgi:hypothetical protein
MSIRAGKIKALVGIDHANKTSEELKSLFRKVLDNGMHGLCFSTYEDGQGPGTQITYGNYKTLYKMGEVVFMYRWE